MLTLNEKNIALNCHANSKDEAIHMVAEGLITNGNVAPEFEQKMLKRETQISTYLGNGIAIPHGTLDARELIKETGVFVAQFPQGVDWGEGKKAYVVIGIAATSDKHLALLKQLTYILGNENQAKQLATTSQLTDFLHILNNSKPPFSCSLISLEQEANNLVTLSLENATKLHEEGYCSSIFISQVLANEPLDLGLGCFLNDASKGNLTNGIAIARSKLGTVVITVSQIDDSLDSFILMLNNPAVLEMLKTASEQEIVNYFQPTQSESHLQPKTEQPTYEATVLIKNEHGLHARPAKELVAEAKKYQANIKVKNEENQSQYVNGKSLMKVIALGTTKGQHLHFIAQGDDAKAAIEGLKKIVADGLGE